MQNDVSSFEVAYTYTQLTPETTPMYIGKYMIIYAIHGVSGECCTSWGPW